MLSPIMNEMNYIIKMLERIHPWFISTTTKVPLFGCLITFCLTENTRSSYRRAWHRVFLYRIVLNICRSVEWWEDDSSEGDIPHHEREPGNWRSVGDMCQSSIFGPHLYELLSHLKLYFSERTNEVTCCIYQDVFRTEIPSLEALKQLIAFWFSVASLSETDLIAVQLYGQVVMHRHESKSTSCSA